MGLSCHCYDYHDYDSWFERGGETVPPAGTTCCECNAPLPAGEPAQTIDCYDVYQPKVERPPHPDEVLGDEHGWDSDREAYVEESSLYRCDRCAGLATALDGSKQEGGLGYCMIGPGSLIEAHRDYIEMTGGHEMIWTPDRDGVLNPRRMTRWDFARREARRRWRRVVSFVWYGGWRTWLRWQVWSAIERRTVSPVMRRLGYERHYDYTAKKLRWRVADRRRTA